MGIIYLSSRRATGIPGTIEAGGRRSVSSGRGEIFRVMAYYKRLEIFKCRSAGDQVCHGITSSCVML